MDFPKNFTIANRITAKWEKGLVDHPSDPGGITYNGVSLRFLQDIGMDIDGDGDVDADDIIKLARDKDQAKVDEVFYRYFWKGANLDEYTSLPIQIACYDANVNTGKKQAAKFLQRAINTLGENKIAVDGAIGPKSMEAMRFLVDRGHGMRVAFLAIDERVKFYKSLCESKPSYKVFLKGWLNRTNDLRAYIDQVGA